jgi:DNA recombination protein RmuC
MTSILIISILVAALTLFNYWKVKKSLTEKEKEIVELKIKRAELEVTLFEERKAFQEKIPLLEETRENLSHAFRALSQEALEKSNRSFLELARASLEQKREEISSLVSPVKESLKALEMKIERMSATEKQLYLETSNLAKALRSPNVRGRWGEIQLKRVVEISGMLNHCDFYEQVQEETGEGRFRPDLIVRLPGDRQVVIDAKVPLEAYLAATSALDEETRQSKLKEHAKQVRSHLIALGRKSYWEKFQPTPEFVVLFLSSETFFSAALEFDPTLIEYGVEQGVIIATPTTLIALLRSISYGWKQKELSQNAKEISELGYELYKRLVDMSTHFSKLGRSLKGAVEDYNRAIGSLETRVLVSARRLKDLHAAPSDTDLDAIEGIEKIPRLIQTSTEP